MCILLSNNNLYYSDMLFQQKRINCINSLSSGLLLAPGLSHTHRTPHSH